MLNFNELFQYRVFNSKTSSFKSIRTAIIIIILELKLFLKYNTKNNIYKNQFQYFTVINFITDHHK
jgi:hypothetical protein